ncbi:sensor domain-containing protein [Teichococcus coralli]|nr:bifunctional diguanylate cyclase/phosphodiesterase [Pseudoroseomonas coralli]
MIDMASAGIWQVDDCGRTLFANTRLAALFGGSAPSGLAEAGLLRTNRVPQAGPFGFSLNEEEATIPARGGRSEVNLLVACSPWNWLEETAPGAGGARQAATLTLTDITELKRAQARTERRAWRDELTGLANRAGFQRLLEGLVQEPGRNFTLLLLDLDKFKSVNDRHGHAAGDILLCEAAGRMRAAMRGEDLVCRLGGNEFAVLAQGRNAEARMDRLACRLSRALSRPVQFNGLDLPLSASIGYARFPADGKTPDAVLQAAGLALHKVKHAQRGTFMRFDAGLLEAERRRNRLREALPAAIAQGKFVLLWQPQFTLGDQALCGAEALLRWPDCPAGPNVSPAEFLAEARSAGLMPAIDQWVLHTALRQAALWSRQPRAPRLVAINISAATLSDRRFPAQVAEALASHSVAPQNLEIEIPEDIAAQDLDALLPILQALRGLGVRVALDDLGGGLSSLAHLVRLPVDRVKLDRSLVAGLSGGRQELALLRALVAVSQSLAVPVLAEGVETAAQDRVLRREGVHAAQGFLYSRPVPADLLTSPSAGERHRAPAEEAGQPGVPAGGAVPA